MKVKMFFRRLIKKFMVKWYRIGDGGPFKTYQEEEKSYDRLCTGIVRKMISHPDSKFTIAPLSGKRYIINKTLDIFIIIEDTKVEITNHVYHYVIKLIPKDANKLVKNFDKKVDEVRLKYEDEIKSQIQNSLNSIFEKINQSITNINKDDKTNN
jgi:hypothetical protein